MRFLTLLQSRWLAIPLVIVLLLILSPPTPHWRETSSQSCHLCGNRRVVIRNYRWWKLDRESVEPVVGVSFPIPQGHSHDWWQYSATYQPYAESWAADNSSQYQDGRRTWTAASASSICGD